MPRLNPSALRKHQARQVHAASLRGLARELRQAHQDKQEAPGVVAPEASTDSNTILGGVKWSLNRV